MTEKNQALVAQVDLVLGPLPDRWFCVNRIGVALLCADKKDAEINALNCDAAYPAYAPHRVVLLGDVSAADKEWSGKMKHADARVRALTAALREVLEFQSAPTGPTIHDWGRWRRVADDSDFDPWPNAKVKQGARQGDSA